MGKYGNISCLICQSNKIRLSNLIYQSDKIIDAEKLQEIERLLIESYNLYEISEMIKKKSEEYGDDAIKLILSEGIDINNLLIGIKKKVLENDL